MSLPRKAPDPASRKSAAAASNIRGETVKRVNTTTPKAESCQAVEDGRKPRLLLYDGKSKTSDGRQKESRYPAGHQLKSFGDEKIEQQQRGAPDHPGMRCLSFCLGSCGTTVSGEDTASTEPTGHSISCAARFLSVSVPFDPADLFHALKEWVNQPFLYRTRQLFYAERNAIAVLGPRASGFVSVGTSGSTRASRLDGDQDEGEPGMVLKKKF